MKQIFSRTGFWWNTMGFTRCHLIGIFVTETVVGTLGLASLVGAVLMATTKEDRFVALCLFLTAICLFLIQIGVLLSSILSLLFYAGSRDETRKREHETSSQQATAPYSEPAGRRRQQPHPTAYAEVMRLPQPPTPQNRHPLPLRRLEHGPTRCSMTNPPTNPEAPYWTFAIVPHSNHSPDQRGHMWRVLRIELFPYAIGSKGCCGGRTANRLSDRQSESEVDDKVEVTAVCLLLARSGGEHYVRPGLALRGTFYNLCRELEDTAGRWPA